jgi:hypothetical protein
MKSFNLPLIASLVAIILFAIVGWSIIEYTDLDRGTIVRPKPVAADTIPDFPIPDTIHDFVFPDTIPDFIISDTALDFAVSSMAQPQAKPPILTIDGKGDRCVYLQSLDIQIEVTGNIASTRYTMIFKNKTNQVLEGELTFPLPDGRSVTHYALDIDGRMREAVPVEKARATQVFEEIQRRGVDPGILERVDGNNFRTRIYPFPRNGTRTISIGYEEELTLENGLLYYRLPMAYPELEKFTVRTIVWKGGLKPIVSKSENEFRFGVVDGNYVAAFTRENYQPSRALIFALPAPADIPQVMMQQAQESFYFLASVAPNLETREKQWGDNLAIIWDVSLSGLERNLQREMELLNTVFLAKKNANVHLYFLNNKFKKIISKKTVGGEYKVINGNWNELKKVLENAAFDGGTDFSQIDLNNTIGNEILFFSDGLSTLSDADFIKDIHVNRPIHCVISSTMADYSAMRLISSKTKGKFVNINALSSAKLKNEVLNETMQFLGAEHGSAIREVYPSIATPVHGNFSLAGISSEKDTEITLLFGFGDQVERRIKVKLEAKNAARQGNIYRIWAQKKIAELDLDYRKNRAVLTKLGWQFGIVTRNTTLMVLELISDYINFDIEPPASEPALRAEFHRKGWRQRDTERDMFDKAVMAAQNLKKMCDSDFMAAEDSASTQRGIMGYINNFIRSLIPATIEPDYFDSLPEEPVEIMAKFEETSATIKSVRIDSDYLNKLTGDVIKDYQTYLKLRNDYGNTPAFYFNMADWFFKHNDKETALRVLTSIAELGLEDASLYRMLGYFLKKYGEYALQKFVYLKVLEWRPMEPQNYRDYALALTDNGEPQAALDLLYSLLLRPFSTSIANLSRGTEEAVVTEINRLIAEYPNLDILKIDERLIINCL